MRKLIEGNRKDNRLEGSRRDDEIFGYNGDDILIGHRGDDTISGGKGDNRIFGGQGLDTLTGNQGKDRFIFNSDLAVDADLILDFRPGVDRIVLDTRVFDEYSGKGQIETDDFVFGTEAVDADDHLIYDIETGQLFYDSDGNGAMEKVLLATFDNNASLTAADVYTF